MPPSATTFAAPLRLPALLRALQPREFPRKLGLCDRLFGRTLARHGIVWVRTAPGPVWKLDLANATHRWLVYGSYEGPGFWRWFKTRRASVHTIVDSGANIGQTVLNFRALAPSARILAYEPGQTARAWLAESASANAFADILISPSGLGSTPRRAYLAPSGPQDRHGAWNQVSATAGEPIDIVTLDDEIARLRLPAVDLWKLDMEGYEPEALRGAEQALSTQKIRAVLLEAAGETGLASTALLRNHGYTLHTLTPAGRLTPWAPHHPFDNLLALAPE